MVGGNDGLGGADDFAKNDANGLDIRDAAPLGARVPGLGGKGGFWEELRGGKGREGIDAEM